MPLSSTPQTSQDRRAADDRTRPKGATGRFSPLAVSQHIKGRAEHTGLHGKEHTNKQRYIALLMIGTGLLRVCIWVLLLGAYLAHLTFARSLFASVAFVSVLSVLALVLTDWGQVAASLAQLTAGDAHRDSEHTRERLGIDFSLLESDIGQLAELQPGPEAWALAQDIRERLNNTKGTDAISGN